MNRFLNVVKKHPDLAALAGIVLVTFLLFARAIPFESSGYDDSFYIGQHEMLHLNAANLSYWFTHPVLRLYSPLAMYTYMADFAVWGADQLHAGIRIQSLFWHITAAAFFYGLLRLLQFRRGSGEIVTLRPVFAFLTALVFALHPQRIESVVWLSERKDVLMAALGTAALYFFLKAHQHHRTSIAAPLLLFLSFGTKPMLVTLPCVMALLLWSQDRRIDGKLWLKRLALPVSAVVVYFIFNALQLGTSLAGTEPWNLRLLRSLWNTGNYFTRVYLPCDLQTIYPLFDPQLFFPWRGLIFVGIMLCLIVLGAFRREYRASLYFGILPCLLAYAGTLFPVSGIVSIGNVDCADRYSYFPSLFLCIPLGFLMQLLWNNFPRYRKIVSGVFVFYTAVLAVQTHYQLDFWRSFRHYLAAALDTPTPSQAILWLAACSSASDGQLEELNQRLAMLVQASRDPLHQQKVKLFSKLTHGVLLFLLQKPDQGIVLLDAVYSDPAWNTLRSHCYGMLKKGSLLAAGFYQKRGKNAHAEILFRMAADLAKETDIIESECYSGLASLLVKDLDAAEQHFQNALRYAPDDRNIQANLQTVCMLKTRAAQQKEAVKK